MPFLLKVVLLLFSMTHGFPLSVHWLRGGWRRFSGVGAEETREGGQAVPSDWGYVNCLQGIDVNTLTGATMTVSLLLISRVRSDWNGC